MSDRKSPTTIQFEEHDQLNNAKRVNLVAGDISVTSQITVVPLQAWPDPKTYIGLVTITGSLAAASGNITLDPGSQTGIKGNVTIDSIGSTVNTAILGNVTLSDPKGFIGLVTVVGSLSPAAGNVTLDAGSLTGITGNVTVEQGTDPWIVDATGQGDVPVTLGGEVVSTTFSGNVTLDAGSKTGIIGNITVDQVDTVTTVTAVTDITNPVALKGNVTIQDGGNSITVDSTNLDIRDLSASQDDVAITGNVTLSDSKNFIGLVTVGNTVSTTFSGNVTIDSGTVTLGVNDGVDIGDVDVTSNTAWADPKTYIGLVTITGSLSPAAGNITLDAGSLTGITGNVTVEQGDNPWQTAQVGNITIDSGNVSIIGNLTIDQVDTVVAVTDITNPIALKGNVTLSDSKTFIGLVTVGSMQPDNIANVSITNTETVSIDTEGASTVAVQITGTWGGNIDIDATVDGTTWVNAYNFDTENLGWSTGRDANGIFLVPCAGYNAIRAIGATVSSGTAVVSLQAGQGSQSAVANRTLSFQKLDALADNTSNTIKALSNTFGDAQIQQPVFPFMFDGSTWDRVRGDSTDGLLVNLGTNNDVSFAGNVTLDAGSLTGITGNITIDQVDVVTSVTDITNPVATKGNVTIDSGTITAVTNITNPVAIAGNLTLSDPKGFIGLVTIVGSLSPAAGNVTLDAGSLTGILGNVTVEQGTSPWVVDATGQGDVPVTLGGEVVDTTFSGNITIDSGVITAVTDITNPVALKGNVTLSDAKTFIGLTTVVQSNTDRSIVGNITLSDPKGFIGLVTIVGSLSPAAGNITLDRGSLTGIVGNVTVDLVDTVTTVTAVTDITNPVALKGNVTLSDSKTSIGLVTISGGTAWTDPKTYIGLVTITGSLAPAAGNITLDAGSLTGVVGNVTVEQGDNPWVTSNVGNITVEQGDDPWVTSLTGNVSISSNTAWPDPKTYIGLVTITGSLAPAAGNITLDAGSLTGIVGNITVDQVDTVTTVTAVTDITNPIALKGNVTISDSKGFIGLTSVSGFTNPLPVTQSGAWGLTGNITVDQVDTVTTVTAVTDITNPVALKGNVTLSDAKTSIGLVTLSGGTAWTDPKTYIGLVTITGSLAPAAGNITLDAGSLTGIIGNVTIDSIGSNVNVVNIGNVTIDSIGSTVNTAIIGNVTVDQVDTVVAVTDITNPIALKGNVTLSDPKTYIGLVTTTHAPISLHTTVQVVISADGQTAISTAVAANFFTVKDIFVSSLGRAEVRIEEGSTVMIPYTALATTSGYALHFGEDGLRAGTVNTALNARLNGAATVSIMANMRWTTT